jgi:putative lipoic acid-binding regulatory protein
VDFTKFKALLDEQVEWPDHYTFKFLVKSHKKEDLVALIDDHHIQEKTSSKGNYVSITSRKMFTSSDEVVAVYHKVSKIEGIMSL